MEPFLHLISRPYKDRGEGQGWGWTVSQTNQMSFGTYLRASKRWSGDQRPSSHVRLLLPQPNQSQQSTSWFLLYARLLEIRQIKANVLSLYLTRMRLCGRSTISQLGTWLDSLPFWIHAHSALPVVALCWGTSCFSAVLCVRIKQTPISFLSISYHCQYYCKQKLTQVQCWNHREQCLSFTVTGLKIDHINVFQLLKRSANCSDCNHSW